MIAAMERHAWVHVDIDRLIQNAERAGVRMTRVDAEKVLKMWGFASCGDDVWLCHEGALGLLRDDEIRSQRVLGKARV